MSVKVTARDLARQVDVQLRAAGVTGLLVAPLDPFAQLEILVRRQDLRRAAAALDALDWRWRVGPRRPVLAGRCEWVFDGRSRITLQSRLAAHPLPGAALAPLGRELWRRSPAREPGLHPVDSVGQVLHVASQAHRIGYRWRDQQDVLQELLQSVASNAELEEAARRSHLSALLHAARRSLTNDGAPPGGWHPPRDGRIWAAIDTRARRASRKLPDRLRAHALGLDWQARAVRVRFAGLELVCGPGTFLPRAESEGLVSATLREVGDTANPVIVDVACGCGAVGLAVKSGKPDAFVAGVELDSGALRWARRNAESLGMSDIRLLHGSLLEPVHSVLVDHGQSRQVDVVVANLPLLTTEDFEGAGDASALAYRGEGEDGLALHRELATRALGVLRPGGALILQLAPPQWETLRPELVDLGFAADDGVPCGSAVVGVWRSLGSGLPPLADGEREEADVP